MKTIFEIEESQIVIKGKSKIRELFTVPRNRRGLQASQIVMFMQQVRLLLHLRLL